jgi:serine/threonine protein kinase
MPSNHEPDIPTTAPNDQLPRRLAGKLKIQIPGYKLISIIGRGGQAVVAKAIRESTGKLVAIKLLREGPLADEWARERLKRETAVLAALDHPNIVTIIDRGQTPDGYDFLVMNYIAGQPLDLSAGTVEDLTEHRPDPSSMLRLFVKICQAVNTAHLQGIVHRDLSPSNILVDEHGEPHILDFGLARTAFDRYLGTGKSEITIDGQFLGKVGYASPEQARGDHQKVDIRTDVYALGVILYQMLTGGQYPYNVVGNMLEVLDNIIHAQPTPPSRRVEQLAPTHDQPPRPLRQRNRPVVNPVIEAIVMKALAKNPADRYQSAGELARDVENYLAGQPTLAAVGRASHYHPRKRLQALRDAPFQRPFQRAAIALAAVGLVLIIGWRIVSSRSSSDVSEGAGVVSSVTSASPRQVVPLNSSQGSSRTGSIQDSNGEPSSSFTGPVAKNGTWKIENQELVALTGGEIVFGDPHWSSYELSFQARAEHEPTVFGAMVHRFSDGNEHRFLLGMGHLGNDGGRLLKIRGDPRPAWSSNKDTHLEYGHWYEIRIDARVPYYHCFVDGQLWAEGSADQRAEGQVGLQAHWLVGPVRFRNIKVAAGDGRILWSGLPDLSSTTELPIVKGNGGDETGVTVGDSSGDPLPLNSVWTGTWPAGRGTWSNIVFVVTQRQGNSFTAIYRSTMRDKSVWTQIVRGQIDGNKLHWNAADVEVRDGERPSDQNGTIEGDTLTLDWSGKKGPPTRVLQRAIYRWGVWSR